MVNPMIDILFRSNDVFDTVSSLCHFCEWGLDKTCPQITNPEAMLGLEHTGGRKDIKM